MPRAGERHRHPARIRRRDDFRVLHRAARLDRRRRARFRRRDESVGKRKKRVAANHAACRAAVSPRPPSTPRCGWNPRGSSGPRPCPASGLRRRKESRLISSASPRASRTASPSIPPPSAAVSSRFSNRRRPSFSNRAAATKMNPRPRCAHPTAAPASGISGFAAAADFSSSAKSPAPPPKIPARR